MSNFITIIEKKIYRKNKVKVCKKDGTNLDLKDLGDKIFVTIFSYSFGFYIYFSVVSIYIPNKVISSIFTILILALLLLISLWYYFNFSVTNSNKDEVIYCEDLYTSIASAPLLPFVIVVTLVFGFILLMIFSIFIAFLWLGDKINLGLKGSKKTKLEW